MKTVKNTQLHDEPLTNDEKIRIIVTETLSPVIVGAIYYYGWKKKLPIKASQANKWSFVSLFIFLPLYLFFSGILLGILSTF